VKKPVSKLAFQVHNLQRYNAVTPKPVKHFKPIGAATPAVVGLCTFESS
jgi:hypothetical protein